MNPFRGYEVCEDVPAVLEEVVVWVVHGVGVHAEGALAYHVQRQTCRDGFMFQTL